MRADMLWRLIATYLLASIVGVGVAHGYGYRVLQGTSSILQESSDTGSGMPIIWALDEVSFNLQFDGNAAPSSTALLNQTSNWNENALSTLNAWNESGAQFTWREGTDQIAICDDTGTSPDQVNSTGWSSDYCGIGWGTDVLAVTEVTYIVVTTGGEPEAHIVDTNIVLNSSERWDAYDGSVILTTNGGQAVFDFQRVVLHELGHALGLIHPDEVGQSLSAIMNSREDGTFRLMTDDLNGVNALYPSASDNDVGAGGGVSDTPDPSEEASGSETSSAEASTPSASRKSSGGGAAGVLEILFLIACALKARRVYC